MDINKYETTIDITVKPLWHDELPLVRVRCFDQETQMYLSDTHVFSFKKNIDPGTISVSIEFLNKKDSDTVVDLGLDKAVIIESVKINGIKDDRFIWKGQYCPEYPEPWYSQQDPAPPDVLSPQNYLSWNGEWKLEISIPAFTWMHQVLGLGWIHD